MKRNTHHNFDPREWQIKRFMELTPEQQEMFEEELCDFGAEIDMLRQAQEDAEYWKVEEATGN